MKQISISTKKGQALADAYNRATLSSVTEAYNRPSTEKTRAEYFCRRAMIEEGGQGYKVISYNTFSFSCGWRNEKGIRIETACNTYQIVF